jgi:hypothetical protein
MTTPLKSKLFCNRAFISLSVQRGTVQCRGVTISLSVFIGTVHPDTGNFFLKRQHARLTGENDVQLDIVPIMF